MASLSRCGKDKNHWRILFISNDGHRKTVRIGRITKRAAEIVKTRVEALLAAKMASCPLDPETARWITKIGDQLAGRLCRCGLMNARAKQQSLGQFIDFYTKSRPDLKPNTVRNYRSTREVLAKHFGYDKPLGAITQAEAQAWRAGLVGEYAQASVSRHVKRAKQFFSAAIREGLLIENPFQDLKAGQQNNPSREFFVTREMTQRVLDECSGTEWRLIVALARFGALRTPSETLALQWGDINWERGRMTVRSPKTEHHANGASRVVPIFSELRPYLDAAWELAADGATFVITKHRQKNCNLRASMMRFIRRAGLNPWPRCFHNLRASRQTELAADHPLHVVNSWCGCSAQVAMKHYLTVRESDFDKASGIEGGTVPCTLSARGLPAESGKGLQTRG